MKNIWRVICGLCLGVVPLNANAFWSWVGPFAHHQDYTVSAIGAPTTFTFAGQTSSPSGQPFSFSQNAIDQINKAHAEADDPANYSAVDHFDSEELIGGFNQIVARRIDLNKALMPPISPANQQKAWDLLGFMVHAVQDFYAHSSWIEEGNTDIVAVGALQGFGALTDNTAAPTIPSFFQSVSVGAIADPVLCGSAGYPLLPPVNHMTTGYYDPLTAPSGKCDHGTLSQAIATCAAPGLIGVQGISKDSPCASYPLGPNHFTAASLAQEETLAFVQSVVGDLNTANNMQGFCALLDLNIPMCTKVVLTSNPSWVVGGASVTFSVVVPPAGTLSVPTGTVTVTDDTGAAICTITLGSNGTGTCTYSYPSTASHIYTASYSGPNMVTARSASITNAPFTAPAISGLAGSGNFFYADDINSSGDMLACIVSTNGNSLAGFGCNQVVLDHAGQLIVLSSVIAAPNGLTGTVGPGVVALNPGDAMTGDGLHLSDSGSMVATACQVPNDNYTVCTNYLISPSAPGATTYTASAISGLAGSGNFFYADDINSSGDMLACIVPTNGNSLAGFGCNQVVLDHAGQLIVLSSVIAAPNGLTGTVGPGVVALNPGDAMTGDGLHLSDSGSMVATACQVPNDNYTVCTNYLISPSAPGATTYTASAISGLAGSGNFFYADDINSSGDMLACIVPTNGNSLAGFDCNQVVLDHAGQLIVLSSVIAAPNGLTGTVGPGVVALNPGDAMTGDGLHLSDSGSMVATACQVPNDNYTACADYEINAPYSPTYSVVVSITGLNGSLTLQNDATDTVAVSGAGNGIAVFPTAIVSGSKYQITVLNQPAKQTCTVRNGSGVVTGALVTNVNVTCSQI